MGVDPAQELKRLEAREKALSQARTLLSRKKQRFIFNLTNKLRAGQPTALTAPEALLQEERRQVGLMELVEKGSEALKETELEVDEYFIILAETTAQTDIANKRDTNKPIQQEIEEGKLLKREFIDVLTNYLGPGYAMYFDKAYTKALSDFMPPQLPDTLDTEEERSFWDTFTKTTMAVGGAVLGFFLARRPLGKLFQKTLGKRLSKEASKPIPKDAKPGVIQDIVEEAKKRASKVSTPAPQIEVKPPTPKPKTQKTTTKKSTSKTSKKKSSKGRRKTK